MYSRLLRDCAEVNKGGPGASRQMRPGYGGLRGQKLLLRFALLAAAKSLFQIRTDVRTRVRESTDDVIRDLARCATEAGEI